MPNLTPARVRLALLALALGGFGIGCTEFVAMGLLPDLARDLLPGVWAQSQEEANGQAGALIAAYAAGVVVGAPTIAALSARVPRKGLLLILAAVFAIATLASAVLPSFGLVLVARFVAALPHGAYFGVASLVAASLLGPGRRGLGAAFVLGGLTIANVVGVPAITWLGQEAGWRVAYVAVTAVFLATFAAILFFLPKQEKPEGASVRGELRAFRQPQVWLTIGVGAIGFGALFAVYSYVSPIATEVAGLELSTVPLLLVVYGIGMTIGNFTGGWLADRGARRALIIGFVAIIVSTFGLYLLAGTTVGLFVLSWGLGAATGLGAMALQVRLLDVAGESQTIAAALNHSALNVANALGAAIGGATVAAGLGYRAPIAVGVVMASIGLVLALASFALERRADRRLDAELAQQRVDRELVADLA
ncbi:MFS transporter [Naasia sp. SYSU D00948]|uniref:MFS transporter n=1 Tax=Naasia sp. SYSU D00948 TaxID=2817379 RepID=UPI001B3006F9|nr:MFS transporter [Naasia sp. SYSU D00948]